MNAFDLESSVYDDTFTNSKIGLKQRARVHAYLDNILNTDRTLNILELNCGTGEDAMYMAKYGHNVIASDNSTGMLQVAKSKAETHNRDNVKFTKIDIERDFSFDQKFHLVFSNFGGLNCISQEGLEKLAVSVTNLLDAGGSFIAVIMPKSTLIEKWYRLVKNQSEVYNSRSESGGIQVKVNKGYINTYFFNPNNVETSFGSLEVETAISIGFVPSYLESSFFLPILQGLDKVFTSFKVHPKYADHFLIHLKKSA